MHLDPPQVAHWNHLGMSTDHAISSCYQLMLSASQGPMTDMDLISSSLCIIYIICNYDIVFCYSISLCSVCILWFLYNSLSVYCLSIYIYTLIILYDMISAWRTFNAVDPVPGMSTCRIWAWRVLLSFVQSKAEEELLSALLDCISRTPQQ